MQQNVEETYQNVSRNIEGKIKDHKALTAFMALQTTRLFL